MFPWSNSPWCGQALGANSFIFTNIQCNQTGVVLHEFGHTLGLAHAATPSYEYGDGKSIMGGSNYRGQRGLWTHSYQKLELNDLASSLVIEKTQQIRITHLEKLKAQARTYQFMQIQPKDKGRPYYLSLRLPSEAAAQNSDLAHEDELFIHQTSGNVKERVQGFMDSYRHGSLKLGKTMTFYNTKIEYLDYDGYSARVNIYTNPDDPAPEELTEQAPPPVEPQRNIQLSKAGTNHNHVIWIVPNQNTDTIPTNDSGLYEIELSRGSEASYYPISQIKPNGNITAAMTNRLGLNNCNAQKECEVSLKIVRRDDREKNISNTLDLIIPRRNIPQALKLRRSGTNLNNAVWIALEEDSERLILQEKNYFQIALEFDGKMYYYPFKNINAATGALTFPLPNQMGPENCNKDQECEVQLSVVSRHNKEAISNTVPLVIRAR